MIKLLATAAVITFSFTSVSFAAAMAKCDEATMTMVMDAIKKDTDPKMAKDVKMANDEMAIADKAMKAKNTEECSKHIDMAKKHMMMK